MRRLASAVGEADQAEGEEVVEPDRLLVRAPQVEHEAADERAEQRADADADGDGPEHVDREPAPERVAEVVQAEQAEAEQDEGKRRAVVEAGLAGQREAQPVAIASARATCTSEASTGSVGARMPPSRIAAPSGRPSQATPAPAMSATVTSIETSASRSGSSQRPSPQADAHLQPRPEQRQQQDDLGDPLERARHATTARPAASRARAG